MKKQFIAAIVLGGFVAFSPSSQAQEKKRGPDAAEQFKQLTELLALTAEQTPKIAALVKELVEKYDKFLAEAAVKRKKQWSAHAHFDSPGGSGFPLPPFCCRW